MFSRLLRSGMSAGRRATFRTRASGPHDAQPHGHGHADAHGHGHGHGHGDAHGHGHGHHRYGEQPGGFLFNLRPGERYVLEGWEIPFYGGIVGSIALFSVAMCYLPDTSLDTWAKKEAEKRLKETNARF